MLDARSIRHQALGDDKRLAAVPDLAVGAGGEETGEQGVEVIGRRRRIVPRTDESAPGAGQGPASRRVAPGEKESHRAVAVPVGVRRVADEGAGEVVGCLRVALLPSEQAPEEDMGLGETGVEFEGLAQVRFGGHGRVGGNTAPGRARGLRFQERGQTVVGLGPLPGRAGCGFQDPVQGRPGRLRVAGDLLGRTEREPGGRQGGVDGEHIVEDRDRFAGPAEAGQGVRPARPCVQIVRVDLRRAPELPFRRLVVVPFGQDQRQVVAGLAVVGVERDRLPQPLLRGRLVAEFDERHRDVEHGLRVARQGLERRFERREGELRVAGAHRLGAAREVGVAADVQRLHRGQEWILVADRDLLVACQVVRRLLPPSQPAQGPPDAVMDDGALGLALECLREMLDRLLEAAGLELHAAETEPGR